MKITKEQVEAATELYKGGYDKVQQFIKEENSTPEFFVKALIWDYENNKEKTAEMFFKDAGAIKWCMEQLQQSEN